MAQKRSFLQHYQTYRDQIFNYLLYRVNFDRDLAEDMTSEIFLKAYEHFDSYDSKRPFKTWIYTISHNNLINYYRSRKPIVSIEEAAELADQENAAEIQNAVDEKGKVRQLMQFLNGMNEGDREMLTLRYLNQLTHAEIASITGSNEGAVRVSCKRALDRLKQIFYRLNKAEYGPS